MQSLHAKLPHRLHLMYLKCGVRADEENLSFSRCCSILWIWQKMHWVCVGTSPVTFQAILIMNQLLYPHRISAPSAKFKVLSNREKRRGSPRRHAHQILNTSSAFSVEAWHAATGSQNYIYTWRTLAVNGFLQTCWRAIGALLRYQKCTLRHQHQAPTRWT